MGNYLYNGIELPQLPEWDKSAYPYACIIVASVTSDTGYTLLYLSTKPFVAVTGESYFTSDGTIDRYKLNRSDFVWEDDGLSNISYKGLSYLRWCNSDITYEDGTLYLAASDPIPVSNPPAPDPFWMLMGWQAGRMIAGMRGKKQTAQPIAYLYNGVQLPDINTVWTDELKQTRPYAVLATASGDYSYRLNLCSMEPYLNSSGKVVVASLANKGTLFYGKDVSGNIVWQDAITVGLSSAIDDVFWTSCDILDTDGTTYLAASAPVPVYE